MASRKWSSRSSQTERAARRRRWDVTFRRDTLHDKYWKPLLRRAGLPDERFHDLRHTCATLLLTKGLHPKIVSERLGHSSIAITLDTYSHVIPGLGEVVASAIGGRAGRRSWRWRPEEVTSPKRQGVDGLMAWKAELA